MRRSDLLEGLRMLKFVQIHDRCDKGTLSQFEAAELLGVRSVSSGGCFGS
jgi:hypothetical protein